MLFWVGIVGALLFVAAAANAAVFYVLYRLSPQRKWRARVERCMAEAQNRLRAERKELKDVSVRLEKETRAIRRRAVDTFLKSLSVAELEAYPGIGPATVSKLRSAGFTNLLMLQEARIRVRGLGAKRVADIQDGIRALVKEARSRFEAGACREAHDLGPALKAVQAYHAQREAVLHARLASAEAVIAEMRPLLKRARQVTFFRYLRRQSDSAVGEEVVDTPLPDLERTIQEAEKQPHASRERPPDGQAASPAALAQREPHAAGSPLAAASPVFAPEGAANVAAAAPLASAELFQEALRPTRRPTQTLQTIPLDLARLEATVELAFAVARADGRIAYKEKEIIQRYVRNTFGDDPVLLNRARALCAHYESAAIDLTRFLHQISELFTEDERRALFDLACEIADATGPRNPQEVAFLQKISSELGVSPVPQRAASRLPESPFPDSIVERPESGCSVSSYSEAEPAIPTTLEEKLALLEIDPAVGLSAELVRRQFNLLSLRYAADKVESMGPEFVAMAENKRTALRAAATALLEQWGEKLETVSVSTPPQDLRHNPDLDAMFGA